MVSRLSPLPAGALQPAHQETIFCQTLVVGNTIAAYTATLAILQAGGQVCWAQTEPLDLSADMQLDQGTQSAQSRFSWRLGRRAGPWETATVMSHSQQAFWANWQPLAAAKPAALAAAGTATDPAAPSKETQLKRAIAPYLANHQLMLIPQGVPVRLLYAENRGQRRVYQVVFRDRTSPRRFQIHTKLVLDGTRQGQLRRGLAPATAPPVPMEWVLRHEPLAAGARRSARGTFFADAIALILGGSELAHRPLSVPLRALLPQRTEGLLCLTAPGCEPALRSLWRQPRVQWAVGEAAGHVAAWAAQAGGMAALTSQAHWQWHLQQRLVQQGMPLFAFDDVSLTDPDFEAIQMVAIADVVRTMCDRDLSFRPETPVTRAVVAAAIARLPAAAALPPMSETMPFTDVSPDHWAAAAIHTAIATQDMRATTPARFAPSQVVSKRQLWQILQPFYPSAPATAPFPADDTPARRRHLSRSLYPILRSRLGKSAGRC
ncbi:MAG TPA: S-layer homology domain-containing protein [Candidatus Obscuribacterales bacterium]